MQTPTAGGLLRGWRQRRRLSQLELANTAGTSARHISFVETGRATPSRAMLLQLCDHLDVPLRERNRLLLHAGYAPAYPQTSLDTPDLAPVRTAVRQLLTGHEPYPAVAVDHAWNLVDANASLRLFAAEVDPSLLRPPVNVLRLSLHPDGLAGRIVNLAEWRAHLLHRQIDLTGSAELTELADELRGYPGGELAGPAGFQPARPELSPHEPEQVVVPLRLRHGEHELAFISTMTIFGTPLSVTVAELAIESFFPADPRTTDLLHTATGTTAATTP